MRLFAFLFFLVVTLSSFAQKLDDKSYERALISFEEQDYPSAMIHLKNTFKENRAHLPARILYAKILLDHQNGIGAELELAYAKELGGDLNLLLPLQAHAYLLQQQFKKAIEITSPATRDRETEMSLAYYRGQAYLGRKKLVFAEDSFDYALTLMPDYAKANVGKAQVYIARRQFALAMVFADKALLSPEVPNNARLIRARLYMIEGKSIEAENILEVAIKKDKNYLAARLFLAEILLSKGALDRAEKEVDYILDFAPKEPQSNFLKFMIAISKNKTLNVEQTLDNILQLLNSLPSEIRNENPQYLFLAGYILYKKKSYLEAQNFFNQYLANVNDLRAIKMQGEIELHLENYISARRLLSKANQNFPNHPVILVMLGKAHMALNEQVKAQGFFKQALLIDQGNIKTLLSLASSYMEQLHFHKAMAELAKIRQAYPNLPQALLLEYECLTQLSSIELAQARTERLIIVAPNNAQFHYLHGLTYLKLADFESAKVYFDKAIAIDANLVDARLGIADINIQKGKPAEAIIALEKLLSSNDNDNVKIMNGIAKAFDAQGNDKAQVVWLEKALSIEKTNKQALISLEQHYRKTAELETFKVRLEALVKDSPDENIHQLLGGIYLTTRDYPKAIKQFKEKVDIAKDQGEAYLGLANAQVIAQDIPGAILTLEEAVLWNDDLIEANILLVKLLLVDKKLKDASNRIDFIRKKRPSLAIADLLRGDWYYVQGQYQSALQSFQLAYNKNKSEKSILSLYRTYKMMGGISEAETLLVNNLDLDTNFDESIIIALADIYKIQNKSVNAIELYLRALRSAPESIAILNNLAYAYIENNQLDQALNYAQKAYDISPDNVVVIDTFATVFLQMKEYDKSLSLLRQAIAVNSEVQVVKYHIALALDGLNRREAAINQLVDVVQSNKDFEEKEEAKMLLDNWVQN